MSKKSKSNPKSLHDEHLSDNARSPWMKALETLRACQERLTFKQIGDSLGCSEKSSRRWAKTVAGDSGGSKPIACLQEGLIELSTAFCAGRVEIVERPSKDGRNEKIAVVHPTREAALASRSSATEIDRT